MILFPNAKINIGLNIIEKRPDGFHNIETLFYPIGLSDILEVNKSNKLDFKNTGLIVENKKPELNLCYKAYQILNDDYDLGPINIHLHKIIPFGAGIGGGSADATFTLKLLNSLFDLKLRNIQLQKYTERIGSDCSFFLLNKPAFATEKGNILNEVDLNLNGYFLVLIHPGIHVNTAIAYSNVTPKQPGKKLTELINASIENWKGKVVNDFEESVFRNHPELKVIKEELYTRGALYASMSGSGSAVYGIFRDEINLKQIFNKYFVWSEWL